MKLIGKAFYRLTILIIVVDICYISYLWFNYHVGPAGEIPLSRFMQTYIDEQQQTPGLAEFKWNPVSIDAIPERVSRVFIIAEDSHFYVHGGLDIEAIKSVLKESLSKQSITRGASTITQQTAKNLYLYPQRSWWRKWHELIFTLLLERTQSKNRILEIYLNIAEFGQGIYGINAASLHYFGREVSAISTKQAAYLAAALPWPQKNNYETRTKTFIAYANRLYSRALKETFPTQ